MELPADFAVLSVPPEERDAARVNAVAAALAAGNVIDLPFLRSLDTEELREACKTQLRVDRLKPGDVVCLQGEEADCAYGVLAGSVSCHVRKDLQPESIYDELLKQITDETVAKAAEGPAVKGIFHVTYALADARRRASVKGASKLSKLRNRMRDDEDEDEDDEDEDEEAAAAPAPEAAPSAEPSEPPSFKRKVGGGYTGYGGLPDRPYLSLPALEGVGLKSAGGIAGGWRRATNAQMTSSAQVAALRTKAANTVGPSVAVLGAGDYFGESGLLNASAMPKRAATAICDAPLALLICPRGALSTTAGADREQKMLDFLRHTPVLKGCSTSALTQVLRNSKRRNFTLNDMLHGEGSKGTSLHLLLSGEITLLAGADQEEEAGGGGSTSRPASAFISPRGPPNRHMPQQLPLRRLGPGQVITCVPDAKGLQEGVVFPTRSKVSSSHAEVMVIECRFLALVLKKADDGGKGLAEVLNSLNQDAKRIATLKDQQRKGWGERTSSQALKKNASVAEKLLGADPAAEADGSSSPSKRPGSARGKVTSPPRPTSPSAYLDRIEMAHPAPGRQPRKETIEPPPFRYLESDPVINASSRFADPDNPSGIITFRPTLTPSAAHIINEDGTEGSHPPTPADSRRPTSAAPSSRRSTRPPSAVPRGFSQLPSRPASARRIEDEPAASPIRAAGAPAPAPAFQPQPPTTSNPPAVPGPWHYEVQRLHKSEIELAITPRQLRMRPQSARNPTAEVLRRQDFLAKTRTLVREPAYNDDGGSMRRPRTAQMRLGRPGAEGGGAPAPITVRVTDKQAYAQRRQMRPRSARSVGSNDGAPSPAVTWQPARLEWQHVARMSAARGQKPPARVQDVTLTPGGGSQQADRLSQQQQHALMASRTPLAVSTLDPETLYEAERTPGVQPGSPREAVSGVPMFASIKRPPIRSNAFNFVSSRRDPELEERANAMKMLLSGSMMSPRSRAANTALRGGPNYQKSGARVFWTRPIDVDGAELAHAMAQQQAALA